MKDRFIITKEAAESIRILAETGLFENYTSTGECVRLKGTTFYFHYRGFRNPDFINLYSSRWRVLEQPFSVMRASSFEEVFDSVPIEIQEKMLYHLDLLRD